MYHFGYYAFYFSYDQHLESKWEDMIYSGGGSIEGSERLIEVPLSMPYMANQEQFQTTNTRYEQDGQYFRVIKQRYQNDTLQLIVLADTERGVLNSAVKKWISLVTEDELPQDQNTNVDAKFFAKDYLQPVSFSLRAFDNTNLNATIELLEYLYIDPVRGIESPPPLFS